MPEATIHEDSEALPSEHDVDATVDVWLRPNVLPEAETATMKSGAQRDLRASVGLSVSAHDRASRRRRWGRRHRDLVRTAFHALDGSGGSFGPELCTVSHRTNG